MNPDRALVVAFLNGARAPLAISSNPLASALHGTLLELDGAHGEARLAFEPSSQFLQGSGVIQGGISATLLDFAMAFAGHAKLVTANVEQGFATASLTVQLLRPASATRLIVHGRILRQGARLMFAEAALSTQADERLMASASAVLALSDP